MNKTAGAGLLIIGSTAAGFAFVMAGRFGFSGPVPGTPRLELPDHPLVLGSGDPGQILDGSFKLRNLGTVPLKYQIRASCGCSQLSPDHGVIPPRDMEVVRVAVRLGEEGTKKDVKFTIESNDPAKPIATYDLDADCPAVLSLDPRRVDFGPIHPGASAQASFRILGKDGRPLTSPVTIMARTEDDSVKVTCRVTKPGHAELTMDVAKDALSKDYATEIVIGSPELARRTTLLVLANIQGEVAVSPKTIFLARQDVAGATDSIIMLWRTDKRPLGPLLGARVPDGLAVREIEGPSNSIRKFRLARLGNKPVPPLSEIHLSFQGLTEPVAVRVVESSGE